MDLVDEPKNFLILKFLLSHLLENNASLDKMSVAELYRIQSCAYQICSEDEMLSDVFCCPTCLIVQLFNW